MATMRHEVPVYEVLWSDTSLDGEAHWTVIRNRGREFEIVTWAPYPDEDDPEYVAAVSERPPGTPDEDRLADWDDGGESHATRLDAFRAAVEEIALRCKPEGI